MAKDVRFNIKLSIDGKEHIVTASTNVKKLADHLSIAKTEADRFTSTRAKFADMTVLFYGMSDGIQKIHGITKDLTAAYTQQVTVESQLATSMKNLMGATDEEIQSIKDLCSAQQQLGVVGDEVQLAGAQELATFVKKKSTLETLIPVMNDMLVQQYGMNATQQNAQEIAAKMNKVLNGQVMMLTRDAYQFTEAQAQVLKFGTEEERAATLAEIVEKSIGGMNAEMAKLDAGKAQQMANYIGDLKEQAGSLVVGFEPALQVASEFGMAISGVGTVLSGVKGIVGGFGAAMKTARIATVSHTASLVGHKAVVVGQAVAAKASAAAQAVWNLQLHLGKKAEIAFAFGAQSAAIKATALRWAIVGLTAATGVGLAIAALTTVVSLFGGSARKASKDADDLKASMDGLDDAAARQKQREEAAKDAYVEVSSQIALYKQELENLIEKKDSGIDTSKEEIDIIGRLNDAYGGTMGYFSSVSGWYDALTKNSETYCKQMVLEARTRTLANQIAEKEAKLHKLKYDENGNERRFSEKRKTKTRLAEFSLRHGARYETTTIPGTSEADKMWEERIDIVKDINDLNEQLNRLNKDYANLQLSVRGSDTRPSVTPVTPPTTTDTATTSASDAESNGIIAQLEAKIADARKRLNAATSEAAIEAINKEIETYEGQLDKYKALGKTVAANVSEGVKEEPLTFKADASNLRDIDNNIRLLQEELQRADISEAAAINREIDLWNDKAEAIRNAGRAAQESSKTTGESLQEGWGSVKTISGSLYGMADALSNDANAWQRVTGLVDGFIGIASGVSSIIHLIDMMTAASAAHATVKATETAATASATAAQGVEAAAAPAGVAAAASLVVANKAAAASYSELAAAEYFAAHAAIPFAGFGIAAGYVAAMKSIVLAIGATPFADGGVVSGPTLALVGEYSGAGNNPEVIAPLDKLKSLIQPADGLSGNVTFEIEGRTLVGVLNRETTYRRRS